MSKKNDDKRNIKKKDQDEFDEFCKNEKRKEKFLKIISFIILLFLGLVFLAEAGLHLLDKNQVYSFTFFSSSFTISFEIVEWYKFKIKPKENSVIDLTMRHFSAPFVLTMVLILVISLIFKGNYSCLKDNGISSDKISIFVLLSFIISNFRRIMLSNTRSTDEMIKRFYAIKKIKREKRKRLKKRKAYRENKKQKKSTIHNEYNNCTIYYQEKE